MPTSDPSPLTRPLVAVTRLVLRYPVPVIALAAAAAVLSVFYAWTNLGFRTSRLDLLNPDSGYNRLWIDYIEEFGDDDDAVVVVEGAGREQVVPVLEEIAARLAGHDELFNAVLDEVDLSRIRAKGLHYLPIEELVRIERFVDKLQPLVNSDWKALEAGSMIASTNARLANEPPADAGDPASPESELNRLADSLLGALDGEGNYQSPWPEMPHSVATLSELGPEYLLANEGRLGIVLLRLAATESGFAAHNESVDALRRLLAQCAAHYPDVEIGLTGLPIMENDETRSSQSDTFKATLLSLVGVAVLFIAGFGSLRHPMLAVIALLVGIAWSVGFLTLAVGHLNILSVAFGVILIGLGIDFGVHYLARYLALRRSGQGTDEALRQTAASVGPGITTGAVTTAISFWTASLTEFTGIAELGLIASGGILFCCVAAVVLLPATIRVAERRLRAVPAPEPLNAAVWLRPLMKYPRLTLAASAAVILACATGVPQVWYDHNLLNLQAEGLESVALERKLLNESDQSVWFALSIAESREELLARKAEFLKLPTVQRTEEIASLLPTDQGEKRPLIARIQADLSTLPERPPLLPVAPPEDLGRLLARSQQILEYRNPTGRVQRKVEQVRDALRRLPPESCRERLLAYQQQMAGDLLSRLHTLASISNPEPPELGDLPEGLVTRFVGQQGHHLLKIYAAGNIWNMQSLAQFVNDVRRVDPRVTGNPLQFYEASLEMKSSYEHAAYYALAAIVVALVFDFRNPRYALLAMMPLALGMVLMFGLLGWLGIPLNPANLIVLPLLLGIGIDDGVHVVHDFRCSQGRFRLSGSTATAVLLTSLTTMVGFGSLMTASHYGLASLGRVLTIGVCCCLFTSLVTLPAMLAWLTRHEAEWDTIEEEDAQSSSRAAAGTHRRHDEAHAAPARPSHVPHAHIGPRTKTTEPSRFSDHQGRCWPGE